MKTGIFSESVDVTFAHTKQLTVDKCSKKVTQCNLFIFYNVIFKYLCSYRLFFQILSFLTSKPMIIQIWGKQKPGRVKPVNNAAKLGQTTRDIMKAEALRKSQGGKATKKVSSGRFILVVDDIIWILSINLCTTRKYLYTLNKKYYTFPRYIVY